ncbi:MAG TPA: FAD-dependent oxidoreductase [Candidatus Acidoferrales bacterium]|nr:FAD-dependent oxidoreductase [Candidatus Acidoferrales bacterium]
MPAKSDRLLVSQTPQVEGPSLSGRHAIVIGCGITGLAAALVLSKRGARVTLLDRDAEPAVGSADAAFMEWERRGAPQVRHSHAFLGRLRTLLRERHPELLQELLDAGARELRMMEHPPHTLRGLTLQPGDEELVALGCRRTTFEWVIRRAVLAGGNVSLIAGTTVRGLIGSAESPPVISGVRYTADGNENVLRADLVIDASGRTSKAVEWLAAIGARPLHEESESSGIIYYTRFYRLLPGASEPPSSVHPTAADFNWVKYAVFPADDRTFSITLAIPLAFPRLKVLAQAAAFDEMTRVIPALVPWVAPSVSESITTAHEVQAMGGLINRLRRFVDDAGPIAVGFFVLGDAAYCTNPLYGRGCAQGFLHAEFLGEALDAHPHDLVAAAVALDRRARKEIEPFYRASVIADRDAVRRAEGRRSRHLRTRLQQRFFEDGVAVATRCDPVVFRAFIRMMNMLETPEQAFGHAGVILRSLWVLARGRRYNRRYASPAPPDRDATIARCEAAAGA